MTRIPNSSNTAATLTMRWTVFLVQKNQISMHKWENIFLFALVRDVGAELTPPPHGQPDHKKTFFFLIFPFVIL